MIVRQAVCSGFEFFVIPDSSLAVLPVVFADFSLISEGR
jgi:hypothetical protein